VTAPDSTAPQPAPRRNRYDRLEWAGAFGDLGTLIPYVVAYVGVVGLHAGSVLLAFGVAMVACGLYYRTPIPVQPMKAIGAVAALQAVQTAVITPAAVFSAALVTGAVWLALGLSGLATRIARLVPGPVVMGILLGLGLAFMWRGVGMMQGDWWVAAIGAAGTAWLMRNRKVPAMSVLLVFGIALGAIRNPQLLVTLRDAGVGFELPGLALSALDWDQFLIGAVLLALPQIPLTLGNAIVAITSENNRLFPAHPVSAGRIATSTGLMNLFSGVVGGVPMCHGAGGMAGHIAFGARTGGSVVILGGVLLVLAVFFSASIEALFGLLPAAVLGVILFIAGMQLALGSSRLPPARAGRIVMLVTAGLCMWNIALGFVIGVLLYGLDRKGWIRL